MAVVGVICEYNPFHLGHARQFRLIRERFGGDTPILCLMSGNYVQRGEPAVFDKFQRARAAVRCGADLVLELPLTCALSSAEGFADGGVEILERLGVADTLCFGSEHGDVEALRETARLLLLPAFGEALREALRGGVSFAAARAEAVRRMGGDASLLRRPNDILAVEYCKALERRGSAMTAAAVLRGGGYHDVEADPEQPSATALRLLLDTDGDWAAFLPAEAAEVLRGAPQYGLRYGERAMLARLRTLEDAAFSSLPGGSEGLWHRVKTACRRECSVQAVLQAAKSKRYAYSRLMRMLMCAYLGLSSDDLKRPPPYVRVLAFGERGRPLLHQARKQGRIPVIHAGETPQDEAYFALECRAADLYTLFAREPAGTVCGLERRGRVYYDRESSGGQPAPAAGGTAWAAAAGARPAL